MGSNGSSEATLWIARIGYAARGVVYALVGILIVWAVVHGGTASPSSRGALEALLEAPLGRPALYLVALGLVCYSLWRFIQCILDADDYGHDAKGVVVRGAMLVSGLLHLALAWSAFAIAGLDIAEGSSAGGSGDRTAMLMQQPFGRWLVGLVGVAIVAGGIVLLVRAWKASFMEWLTVSRTRLGALYTISRLGLAARGVVFLVLGGLFIRAAIRYNPDQPTGMHAAFDEIVRQPHGIVLLGIVGLGMLCFAAYGVLVQARFRRVEV